MSAFDYATNVACGELPNPTGRRRDSPCFEFEPRRTFSRAPRSGYIQFTNRLTFWERAMQERREARRKRTYLGGTLAFGGRYATLDCTIRNVSDRGARVSVDGAALLPDEFDLTVTRNDQAYRARLVWRTATDAGLSLLNPSESAVVTLDWSRRLRAREAENARLRRRISDLSSG
jgi:PilZ domain